MAYAAEWLGLEVVARGFCGRARNARRVGRGAGTKRGSGARVPRTGDYANVVRFCRAAPFGHLLSNGLSFSDLITAT